VKRPALEPKFKSDGTHKKPKVDDESYEASRARLSDGLRTRKFASDNKDRNNPMGPVDWHTFIVHPKGPSGPVRIGTHLDLETIFQAFAPVSEAIYCRPRGPKARLPNIPSLFHPRFMVDLNPLEYPVVHTRQEDLVPIERKIAQRQVSPWQCWRGYRAIAMAALVSKCVITTVILKPELRFTTRM
jgi:hypothetical protein